MPGGWVRGWARGQGRDQRPGELGARGQEVRSKEARGTEQLTTSPPLHGRPSNATDPSIRAEIIGRVGGEHRGGGGSGGVWARAGVGRQAGWSREGHLAVEGGEHRGGRSPRNRLGHAHANVEEVILLHVDPVGAHVEGRPAPRKRWGLNKRKTGAHVKGHRPGVEIPVPREAILQAAGRVAARVAPPSCFPSERHTWRVRCRCLVSEPRQPPRTGVGLVDPRHFLGDVNLGLLLRVPDGVHVLHHLG